jgi:LuxR family transcriptional regulator, quorum-sensing system regulator BjaR1
MAVGTGLMARSESFREMASGEQVLDGLENAFRSLGATHFLATGIPLPERPITTLILRMTWGELRADKPGTPLRPEDGLLQYTLRARRPFLWRRASEHALTIPSALVDEIGSDAGIVGVPICAFLPYQAAVIVGGVTLALDPIDRPAIDHLCAEAFARLFAINFVRPERPGDLSARERKVVELSALGKTANQIATMLAISQRTVHAHLQNASEKLRASNKTHTVVEALRYGQITV